MRAGARFERAWRLALVALLLVSAGCGNPLAEVGLASPKDPGTIVVRLFDQNRMPVAGATVSIVELPNGVGSTYSVSTSTRADGTATFSGVPSGTRTIQVQLPPGLSADPPALTRSVLLPKDEVLTVDFQAIRS